MVESIAKIPDVIKQEVYIKECSRIMDISEEVLFNTLAQILRKERKDAGKQTQTSNKAFEVISSKKEPVKKVDFQFELERKIIELLLLYGAEEEEFEELTLETNEAGEITYKSEIVKTKVYEKIYLDLQEDEIEFTNEEFKDLYFEIINNFNQKQDFKIDTFINQLQPEKSEAITHILMDDEKHVLHNWKGKDIYVKDKNQSISQMVSETILNLRRHLVTLKINELAELIKEMKDEEQMKNTLIETVDYSTLKKILSDKLNRVL